MFIAEVDQCEFITPVREGGGVTVAQLWVQFWMVVSMFSQRRREFTPGSLASPYNLKTST